MPEKEDHRGIWLAAAGATLATAATGSLVVWNLLPPEKKEALARKFKSIPESIRYKINPDRGVFNLPTTLPEIEKILSSIHGYSRRVVPDSLQIGEGLIPWYPTQGTQMLAKPGRDNERNLYPLHGLTTGQHPLDEDFHIPFDVSHPLFLIGTCGVEEQFAWERKFNKPATIDLYGIFCLKNNPAVYFEPQVIRASNKTDLEDEFAFIRMGTYRPVNAGNETIYSEEMYGHF